MFKIINIHRNNNFYAVANTFILYLMFIFYITIYYILLLYIFISNYLFIHIYIYIRTISIYYTICTRVLKNIYLPHFIHRNKKTIILYTIKAEIWKKCSFFFFNGFVKNPSVYFNIYDTMAYCAHTIESWD